MDFLQSSFSGFFAARSSRMAVTSTVFAGSETGAGAAAEAGVVGADGAAEAKAVFGGAAEVEGAAGACPNIFDMRLVNIPIRAEIKPSSKKLPALLDIRNCSRKT